MKFAYADPPYLGQGKKRYSAHHADAADADDPEWHRKLIHGLYEKFPDGWAVSASTPSLAVLLPMMPPGVRLCSWSKPFCVFKPGVGLAYAWEPVFLYGGRKIGRDQPTVRDWIAESIMVKKGLTGAKPERFCFWLFSMLGMTAEDEFVDVFPGTQAVSLAHERWVALGCPVEVGGNRPPKK